MYATQQSLQTRYGKEFAEIAEDTNNPAQLDTARVTRALNDAVAEVDSYIGQRYDLPLIAPFDPVLEKLTGDIAMYNLPITHMARTEHQRQRYEDAIKHLAKIVAGEATLRITQNTGDTETSDAQAAQISSKPRLFTRDTMGKV